jgi:plasmid replication initiation protein
MQLTLNKNLTESEIALFYLICTNSFKTQSPVGTIDMKQYAKEVTGPLSDWMIWTMSMMNDLLDIKGYRELGASGRQYYLFFEDYRYIEKERLIKYRLSKEGFNDLAIICRSYTIKDLVVISKLKGKYTKRLCQSLFDYKASGFHEIPLGQFWDLLEISPGYSIKEMSRTVVKPAIKEIAKAGLLEDLRYRYYKPFQKTESIIFEWTPKEIKVQSNRIHKSDKNVERVTLMNENFETFDDW